MGQQTIGVGQVPLHHARARVPRATRSWSRRARAGAAVLCLVLAACGGLPTDYDRSESLRFKPTPPTRLVEWAVSHQPANPEHSGVKPIRSGMDALVTRIALIDAAEQALDLQYFRFAPDVTGLVLLRRLLAAADRGVRVRLLLDDFASSGQDDRLLALDSHPNFEVRLFNPLRSRVVRAFELLFDFERVNRRMHNKSMTADYAVTVVGGRNIGDPYFDAEAEHSFVDLDVLAVGPVVDETARAFDEYWNSDVAVPVAVVLREAQGVGLGAVRAELEAHEVAVRRSEYARAVRTSPFAVRLKEDALSFAPVRAIVVHDPPTKGQGEARPEALLGKRLGERLRQAKESVHIITPYFVPTTVGVDGLGELADRGVSVTVLTNSLASTDMPVAHMGYARYREHLLERGVRLFEVRPDAVPPARAAVPAPSSASTDAAGLGSSGGSVGSSRSSLHAKVFVIDRRILFVGSLNFDPRSAYINTEMGMAFESSAIVDRMVSELETVLEDVAWQLRLDEDGELEWVERTGGASSVFHDEPQTTSGQRFTTDLLSLLPIEGQL